jgi:hypothetical protein
LIAARIGSRAIGANADWAGGSICPYDPEHIGWVTLHEVGHALGWGIPPTC